METEFYGGRRCEYRPVNSTKGRGGWRVSANLNTGEWNIFAVLADDEKASGVPVVQQFRA